jgi:LuxR family maltose regulon positive regulatory protein
MMGDALARLAELRRRQGRSKDAEDLLARCEGNSRGLLVRAELALERAEFEEAAELADRYLRRVSNPGRIERCAGLEIAVRAYSGSGRLDRAQLALDEFRHLASPVGTRPLRAAVLVAEGTVAAARGDHETARHSFEDALDVLAASGAPFEVARVRLELAAGLAAVGRHREARREIAAALAVFEELGAAREVARAQGMLKRLPSGRPPIPAQAIDGPLASLSGRELEVLALVAEGHTSHQIAERLVLSEHTVNRHVGNILRKLNMPTRAAAASLAGRYGLV